MARYRCRHAAGLNECDLNNKPTTMIYPNKISPEAVTDTLLFIENWIDQNIKADPGAIWLEEAKEGVANLIEAVNNDL